MYSMSSNSRELITLNLFDRFLSGGAPLSVNTPGTLSPTPSRKKVRQKVYNSLC